ncbi:hypothetical protein WCLP8_1880014 [uncultured Gammaproteobacteria bacterium]
MPLAPVQVCLDSGASIPSRRSFLPPQWMVSPSTTRGLAQVISAANAAETNKVNTIVVMTTLIIDMTRRSRIMRNGTAYSAINHGINFNLVGGYFGHEYNCTYGRYGRRRQHAEACSDVDMGKPQRKGCRRCRRRWKR